MPTSSSDKGPICYELSFETLEQDWLKLDDSVTGGKPDAFDLLGIQIDFMRTVDGTKTELDALRVRQVYSPSGSTVVYLADPREPIVKRQGPVFERDASGQLARVQDVDRTDKLYHRLQGYKHPLDFVFFSKFQLEYLMRRSQQLLLSGAHADAYMFFDDSFATPKPGTKDNPMYTLKLEGVRKSDGPVDPIDPNRVRGVNAAYFFGAACPHRWYLE